MPPTWPGITRSEFPWNSPGQNTGVGSLSLLQGNLPNPGNEPRYHLPCRQILYQLSHKGSPTILEWVAYPFFTSFHTAMWSPKSQAESQHRPPSFLPENGPWTELRVSKATESRTSSFLEDALECSQFCAGINQAASFTKGTRTIESLSPILNSPHHWIDMAYSWDLAQQDGVDRLCLVSHFEKVQHVSCARFLKEHCPSSQHRYLNYCHICMFHVFPETLSLSPLCVLYVFMCVCMYMCWQWSYNPKWSWSISLAVIMTELHHTWYLGTYVYDM